jgi:ribosome-associated translation inhibitor RaiA
MNIEIRTAHAHMQEDWHRMIDAWVARCRRLHPEVAGIDVVLRRDGSKRPGDEAMVEVMARGGHLRGAGVAPTMSTALHDALDAVEHELLVREAVTRRA